MYFPPEKMYHSQKNTLFKVTGVILSFRCWTTNMFHFRFFQYRAARHSGGEHIHDAVSLQPAIGPSIHLHRTPGCLSASVWDKPDMEQFCPFWAQFGLITASAEKIYLRNTGSRTSVSTLMYLSVGNSSPQVCFVSSQFKDKMLSIRCCRHEHLPSHYLLRLCSFHWLVLPPRVTLSVEWLHKTTEFGTKIISKLSVMFSSEASITQKRKEKKHKEIRKSVFGEIWWVICGESKSLRSKIQTGLSTTE